MKSITLSSNCIECGSENMVEITHEKKPIIGDMKQDADVFMITKLHEMCCDCGFENIKRLDDGVQ